MSDGRSLDLTIETNRLALAGKKREDAVDRSTRLLTQLGSPLTLAVARSIR